MQIYMGIIENNKSPKKDGKVQVRVFGVHSENNNDVQSEHLPWAEIIQSNLFGFNSGIGISSIPIQGTMVYLFFKGDDFNQPVIIGSVSGKITQKTLDIKNSNDGFKDNDKKYPKDSYKDEYDINRLTRVEKLDDSETMTQKILDNLISESFTVDTKTINIEEPEPLNENSEYPFNSVIETQSGHIIELDDTETNERIKIYHKSGTYFEILPDGNITFKQDGTSDNIFLMEGKLIEYINNSIEKAVKENVTNYIGGDLTEHIQGIVKMVINGGEGLRIKAENIFLGDLTEGPLESMVKGETLAAGLVDTFNRIMSHTHTGNLGFPTSTPVQDLTPTAEIQPNGNAYSKKNKTQ